MEPCYRPTVCQLWINLVVSGLESILSGKLPVKQLLEDYARFIESSPDHVVNSVIKKNLWRDQDYRRWRDAHRAPTAGTAKSSPSE